LQCSEETKYGFFIKKVIFFKMINLDEFITASGEVILTGNPDFDQLENLSKEQVISGIVHLNKVIKCISN
jgi:hypothetical protein